jgi:glycosyltransferase involved in cell wall biosynthesis
MTSKLKWLRALAVDLYLWAQRRGSWPIPGAFRTVVRRVIARTMDKANHDTTQEWANPLLPGTRVNEPIPFPDDTLQGRPGDIPAAFVRSEPDLVCSLAGPRLRCVVATDVLGFGGLDRVAALLGRRLPAFGFDTTIAYFADALKDYHGPGERLVDALRLDGVPVVKLSPREGQPWLKAHLPDVMSIHGVPDWFVAAAAENGIPIVQCLHGAHSFFEPETWPRERLRSKQIDGFVAVSELVRRQYLRANPGYPPDRVITIPNGVDDQEIVHRDRTKARAWLGLRNEFLFVSLARYHLQKNTFGLVTAFSDVARRNPDTHLLVAGPIHDAIYFQQVRRLRDGLLCAGQIHLRENCPDVSTILAAADAFVLDSFFEGWPLASMEALFAGLPVVMSEVGGAREQLGENGRRGFVVGNPLGDPEAIDWCRMSRARFRTQVNRAALAEAMSAVVANRNYWRDARENLRLESLQRFSPDHCVQHHADVLARAVSGELHSTSD